MIYFYYHKSNISVLIVLFGHYRQKNKYYSRRTSCGTKSLSKKTYLKKCFLVTLNYPACNQHRSHVMMDCNAAGFILSPLSSLPKKIIPTQFTFIFLSPWNVRTGNSCLSPLCPAELKFVGLFALPKSNKIFFLPLLPLQAPACTTGVGLIE